MKFLRFIKDFWYIPFFILALILGWVLFRGRRGTPLAQTKAELEAIEAGRLAREMQARLGAEAARKNLEVQYSQQLKALDDEQAAKAAKLRDNPQALARFLVRAGSRAR